MNVPVTMEIVIIAVKTPLEATLALMVSAIIDSLNVPDTMFTFLLHGIAGLFHANISIGKNFLTAHSIDE